MLVFTPLVAVTRLVTAPFAREPVGLGLEPSDLGAKPWPTFLQITLPLSIPGIATGCMLVFILLMGEYLIPAILGGGEVFFVGNALVDLFLQSRNWAFGSAVAVTLIVVMLATVTVYMRFMARLSANRDDVSLI